MSKRIFTLIFMLLPLLAFSQGKKATLMVLPSDNWCNQRHFMTTFEDQGRKVHVPDYQTAFREDPELVQAVAVVGQLMTRMGYSLKDAQQELNNIYNRTAEDNVTMSESGAGVAESPLDILNRRTRSDIIIYIWWRFNAPTRQMTLTIDAYDAYTSKRIGGETGTGKPGKPKDIFPVLLENAIKEKMKKFTNDIDKFHAQTQKEGREIVLSVLRWRDWENNLNTRYTKDGRSATLKDHIMDWLSDNTVNGNFSLSTDTRDQIRFEQVRIPITDDRGRDMDARSFAVGLERFLGSAPFNIPIEVRMRGLGEAILYLGDQE